MSFIEGGTNGGTKPIPSESEQFEEVPIRVKSIRKCLYKLKK